MILSKEVKLKIHPSNFKRLKKIGYKKLRIGNIATILIEHLSKGSHLKIKVKCDVCGKEKKLSYVKYNQNIKNQNYYSCCSKCSRNKSNQTSLERYGFKNVFQNKNIQNKQKQTNLKKYGVENPFQNKEIKEKIRNTNFKKYGYNYPMQNKDIFEKQKQTNLEKYGVKCSLQNEDVKNKQKQTNLKKYGVENPFQNKEIKEKIRNTNFKKYGYNYPMQNKEIHEKQKQTMTKKYGVENPVQNKEIHKKQQISGFKSKNYKNTDLYYRGTYEKHFLDFCFENNIQVENGPSIKYSFDNKKRVYHSDFYLKEKNLVIEIKSNYYYKKYLQKNLAKQKSCIDQGYNFIFINNKNYKIFQKLI